MSHVENVECGSRIRESAGSVIKGVRSKNLMQNTVTLNDNTIVELKLAKRRELKHSHIKKM